MNPQKPISDANQIAASRGEINDIPASVSFLRGNVTQAMAPSIGEGEKTNVAMPRCSHSGCGCADAIHELANSITAVLINAQVLEWKLPPYSRLKRPVREIERHAQRSGALLKDLLSRFEKNQIKQEVCWQVHPLRGTMAAVTAQGPEATKLGPAKLPPQVPSPPAPGLNFSPERELTSVCDLCTSDSFPKEER